MRVAATGVMLDSVIAGFHQGDSPESIQQQYPSLTLAEVYGAIAYYLNNSREVDAYLAQQRTTWQESREEFAAQESPLVQRLRATARAEVNGNQ